LPATGQQKKVLLHNEIARTYLAEGKASEAENAFASARQVLTESFGGNSLELAELLEGQASTYLSCGLDEHAELHLTNAIAIRRQVDPTSRETALLMHKAGKLAKLRYDAKDAVSLLLQALVILVELNEPGGDDEPAADSIQELEQKTLERQRRAALKDPVVATIIADLAVSRLRGSAPMHAAQQMDHAIQIQREVFGDRSIEVGRLLASAGAHFSDLGNYAKSTPMLRESLEILEKEADPSDDVLNVVRHNLAADLRRVGEGDAEAAVLLRRCIADRERAFGPGYPGIAMPLRHLAYIAAEDSRFDEAIDHLARATVIEEHRASNLMSIGSEHDRRNAVDFFTGHANATVAFHLRYGRASERSAGIALEGIVRSRARLLEALRDEVQAVRRQAAGKEVVQRWADLLEAEARWFFFKWRSDVSLFQALTRDSEYDRIRSERESLEKRIGVQVQAREVDALELTTEELAAAMPAAAAALIFFDLEDVDFRMRDPVISPRSRNRYVVFVVRRDAAPVVLDLGEKDAIDLRIERLRSSWARAPGVVAEELRALYLELLRPAEPYLAGIHRLIVDACGKIASVPFCALLDDDRNPLLLSRCVSYTLMARDLVRDPELPTDSSDCIVVADPDFGDPAVHRLAFTPLPGTANEATRIAGTWPGARTFCGTGATKSLLRSMPPPGILHFATHGFHSPDTRDRMDKILHEFAGAPLPSPLLRSGLALSGANLGPDGILTGLEISSLDLSATELVVLSACVSSIGDDLGDSVYGLPRAFFVAGARAVVATQFPVPDEATALLMSHFYANLRSGASIGESLRQAQVSLRQAGAFERPFFWASFVHIGSDRPVAHRG
jgi:CHAT domain-containing protein/tetratricopeptide (TPR) repeat protein